MWQWIMLFTGIILFGIAGIIGTNKELSDEIIYITASLFKGRKSTIEKPSKPAPKPVKFAFIFFFFTGAILSAISQLMPLDAPSNEGSLTNTPPFAYIQPQAANVAAQTQMANIAAQTQSAYKAQTQTANIAEIPFFKKGTSSSTPSELVFPRRTAVSTPYPAFTVLFQDSFDTGISDGWKVRFGQTIWDSNKGLLTVSENTQLEVGSSKWQNYQVDYDIMQIKGRVHTYVNFVDGYNFVLAYIYYDNCGWFVRYPDKEGYDFPNSKVMHNSSFPTHVSIQAVENAYKIFLNNIECVNSPINGFSPGRIVLEIGEETEIDNFTVIQLP